MAEQETNEQFMSRLDRDGSYRITALQCAINRAGQDGGIQGDAVDVYGLAEGYYAWLKGQGDGKKPARERFKKIVGVRKGSK